jgi:adsorption protein B
MIPDLLAIFLLVAKDLLAVVSVCFLVSGCDDCFIDVYHTVQAIYRRLFGARPILPQTHITSRLCEKPQQLTAVMLPAWDESAVIRRMLEANLERIQYEQLHIFVGTYPNDAATQREVELVRERYPNVHRFVCPHDGPTNKSDCLNWVYQGIRVFEKEHDVEFQIFVLNDSEDVIHPLCFKLFNLMIPHLDMVQLPVIPLEVPWWHFTAGHYLDEFTESHAKDMIVRAHLTGAIPAAGVGCAFSRRALEVASTASHNELFSLESLAEDYDLGLRLGAHGLKTAFVRVAVSQTNNQPAGGSRAAREYVGISEYFPSSFKAAVRQKARWIVGISFQGWRRLGWRGNLRTKYALFRDRKGLIANPTVALGYCVALMVVTIWTLQWWDPSFYRFPAIVERGSWLWYVILVNTFFLCLRLVQRCRFVREVYGWKQGLLAAPRQVWANLVNVAATSRAFYLVWRSRVRRQKIAWDKTGHRFPSEGTLLNVRRLLGDVLLEKRLVTVAQLEMALEHQRQGGRPLGAILQELGFVDEDQIVRIVAEQAHLPFRLVDPYSVPLDVLRGCPRMLAIRHSIFPLDDDGTRLVAATARPIGHDDLRLQLERTLSRRVELCLAPESDIAFAIRRGYQRLTARRELPPIGEQLVASGVLSHIQLHEALRQQRRSYVRLGTLLQELNLVTQQALEDALNSSEAETMRLGELLVASGKIGRPQLDAVLTQQRRRFRRIGQVLVENRTVSADAVKDHLFRQRVWAREQATPKRGGGARDAITLAVTLMIAASVNVYAQSSTRGRAGSGEKTGLTEEVRRFRVYPRLDRAYRLIGEHRLVEAKRELENCLAISDDKVEIWSAYLDVLYQLKEYDRLVARFGDAGELRGDVRLRKYHMRAELARHNLDAVLEDLRLLGSRNERIANAEVPAIAAQFVEAARTAKQPDALIAFLRTGGSTALPPAITCEAANVLRGLGRPDEASAAYEQVAQASQAGPLRVAAYQALASLALEQQRWSQAREFLISAHRLVPRDVSVIRSIGDLAVGREDWRDVIAWYGQWVTLSPAAAREERYRAEMILGRAYFRLAEYRHAAEAFSLAVGARPNDVTALVAAAQAWQRVGESVEAVADLKAALKGAPTSDLNAQIGVLLAHMGQPKDALPYLERASAQGVSDELAPVVFGQLGYTYAALNQPKAAHDAFVKALPRSPNQAAIYAALGYASLALDNTEAAIDQFEHSLSLRDDPHVWRDLVLAYSRAGMSDAAGQVVERLRGMPDADSLLNAEVWTELAGAAFKSGRFRDAAALFRRAAAQDNGAGWSELTRAAESLERAEAISEAAQTWDELTASTVAPRDARATAAERAGYLRLRLKDPDRAVASFLLATQFGHDDWRLRLDRSLALINLGRWAEALDESTASLDRHDSARGHIAAALSFKALSKPGMAIHHFVRSLDSSGELEAQDQKYVLDELTALYVDEPNYEAASQAATRSLHISPDPDVALRLARLQRWLGHDEASRATLTAIADRSSPASLRLAALDELAGVSLDLGEKPSAIEALQEAVALESTDTRLYQLGIAFRDVGDLDHAVASLRASVEAAPGNLRHREALGYACLQAGQLREAADNLTSVAQQEPDNVQVQQDLADVLTRLGEQPRAVRVLRQAIARAKSGNGRAEDVTEDQQAVVRMRNAVAEIGRKYEAAGYFGYHALAAPNTVAAAAATPLLLSQSGFEVARYLTGSQQGWSLIGRLMSVTDGETDNHGTRGTLSQFGIGVRYKPFVTQNLNFSAERLFHVGAGLPDSWLIRALYAKEIGADIPTGEQWHPYSLVYGDVAGFIGPIASLFTYGETRFGVSRRLNGSSSWLVRPHVAAVARQDLVGSGGGALQLGAGVGVTRYFKSGDAGRVSSFETRLYGSAALTGTGAPAAEDVRGVGGVTLLTTLRF